MRRASILLLVLLFSLAAVAEDRAVCAVCGPREGSGFEPVKATATYKGKQYFFCSLECKVEFLKNPEEFLVTESGKPAPAFTLKTFDG
ncbi:MAG TPA: YHS domain-containing protein, partial [Thermoanaerobaculia bacterium]